MVMTFNQAHFYIIDKIHEHVISFVTTVSFRRITPSIAEIHFFKTIEICDVFGFQKVGWLWGGLADF